MYSQTFTGPSFGWTRNPAEVARCKALIEQFTGTPATVSAAAPDLIAQESDTTDPVFFWDHETVVTGSILPTWNQLQVGCCVSFGTGRIIQDLLLLQIALGIQDDTRNLGAWTGIEVAPEPIYGGSRQEIGGGNIRGDGSVGAWASAYVTKYGVCLRGKYGRWDVSHYNESTMRQIGDVGAKDFDEAAKTHPVQNTAQVESGDQLWAMLGGGKPTAVCSNRGFTMQRGSDGFCQPSGTWPHCMAFRARFVEPSKGKSVVIGNSWGDYLGSANNVIRYVDKDGTTKEKQLPPGHFATTLSVADSMCNQGDTFAYSGLRNWAAQKVRHAPLG